MQIWNYIEQGGAVMYILLALNMIGFAIMLTKFLLFFSERKRCDEVASSLQQKLNALVPKAEQSTLLELARGELLQYISSIERGLNTVKIIAAISPLLGLLGTVLGVLIAFQVMSQSGLSNPSAFARGISMALITTVGGLVVAIPHYIGHNYLIGMLDRLESNIEKSLLSKIL
ncbi:MAG: MotA/TolQ/ExbB proton channel family protein [Bdellovibrionales bacterium]|jgi:biopolymer transport protein ExbB|nr:MotA/TolQ/ExbB proton channel family protein [Bdellovibrionales bacterium]MBT3525284.1 MotA/TolQ/ExbB proton channel family protein [Bdellovibrionales bacterium]MBT7668590.1 MotA/TolQ/ExbB proton channel family protein [Bdellovibrionales bacterium]